MRSCSVDEASRLTSMASPPHTGHSGFFWCSNVYV